MQHVIRLERDPASAAPWIGQGDGGFHHPDPELGGEDLPLALSQAHKRLGDALDQRPGSWTVTFQNAEGDAGPLVGYGRRFALRREGERQVLTFTHVIALEQRDHLYPAAKAVLRVLADAGIPEITRRLTAVTAGETDVEVFCCWIAKRLEDRTSLASGAGKVFALHELDRIDVIDHDCAGAAGVAWLTMACVMNGVASAWEVYDTGGGRAGAVVTTIEPGGAGVRARAADVMSRGMTAVMHEQSKKSKARAAAAPATPAPVSPPVSAPRSQAPVPTQRRKTVNPPTPRRGRRRPGR